MLLGTFCWRNHSQRVCSRVSLCIFVWEGATCHHSSGKFVQEFKLISASVCGHTLGPASVFFHIAASNEIQLAIPLFLHRHSTVAIKCLTSSHELLPYSLICSPCSDYHLQEQFVAMFLIYFRFQIRTMTSLSSISLLVEKFKGEGFPTWQTKMQLLLMKEGVWGVVEDDTDDALHQSQKKIWKQQN